MTREPAWRRPLTFPLWMLSHPDLRISSILRAHHADGEVAVPLFTDQAGAQAFLRAGPMAGQYVLRAFRGELELLGALVLLEERAVTHVLIDPSGEPGEAPDCHALTDFRAALARAIN